MKIVLEFSSFEEMQEYCIRATTAATAEIVSLEPAESYTPEPEPAPDPEPEQVKKQDQKPEPAPADGKKYAREDVRAKLMELQKAKGKKTSNGLIQSFGVDLFKDVPEEKFGELMEKAEELLNA